jgi:hypothetical protein
MLESLRELADDLPWNEAWNAVAARSLNRWELPSSVRTS